MVLHNKEENKVTLEEMRNRLNPILDAALEGLVHEDMESFFEDIQKDYMELKTPDDGGEWKKKYVELKEKYIKRFLGGEEEVIKEEEDKKEKDTEEEKEDIKIENLLKEEK